MMQITSESTLSTNKNQTAIKTAASDLQSGVPFEIPVSTDSGSGTIKGEFRYDFLQPAGQNIYFTPGQSAAPDRAKQAMTNALQQFLLAMQEDGKAGSTTHTSTQASTHAVDTYSTSTSFQGQNSAFGWSGTFSFDAGTASKTA
jgi:hypothetical protein